MYCWYCGGTRLPGPRDDRRRAQPPDPVARFGPRDDAARKFRSLLQASPRSPVARILLNSVRVMHGRGSEGAELQ
jgi:hypothetical protein